MDAEFQARCIADSAVSLVQVFGLGMVCGVALVFCCFWAVAFFAHLDEGFRERLRKLRVRRSAELKRARLRLRSLARGS